MHQKASKIPPGQSRYVSKDYVGDIDWFIITAFLSESKAPGHVDIDTLPAVRDADDALAFTKVGVEEKLIFVEDDEKKEFSFQQTDEEPQGDIHGW
ncbi:MAG: hypothetical protein ACPK85_13275 [Methanosarcina sp.]